MSSNVYGAIEAPDDFAQSTRDANTPEAAKGSCRACAVASSVSAAALGVTLISVLVWSLTRSGMPRHSDERADYQLWGTVLKKHVHPGEVDGAAINVADYCGIKQDPDFSTVVDSFVNANVAGMSKNETYAFYINAYNVFITHLMIEYAQSSTGVCAGGIRDIFRNAVQSFSIPIIVGGETTSLDQIETMLRNPSTTPGWGWPLDCRIHGCIVCASTSCPNVRADAYRAATIDFQMTDNTQNWLQSGYKGSTVADGKIVVSKIFDWDVANFDEPSCGGGVLNFIREYGPTGVQAKIDEERRANGSFNEYTFFTQPIQTWPNPEGVPTQETGYNWNTNGVSACNATCQPRRLGA